jgi:hypothetical protein
MKASFRLFANAILLLASIGIALLLIEITFRCLGYKTFKPITLQMRGTRMEPKPLFNPDSLIGIKLDSGSYKIYYEDGTYWQTTNNENGYRITAPLGYSPCGDSCIKQIDIFGCSFTYGTGLADSQSYPYILQKLLPHYKINNYAIPGHGMAHNYVRILNTPVDSATIVIYAYILGHDFKTNHANRKKMYPSRNFLKGYYYLYLDDSLNVIRTQYDYKPWPLVNVSAFINYIEDMYIDWLDNMKMKHEASKKAVIKLNEYCKSHHATFLFVILTPDEYSKDMIRFCKEHNILCKDISLDISNAQYNLMPYDDHPNYNANQLYAKQLLDYLTDQKLINP